VEAGEQCDPGTALGSPDCDTACERTVFEPAGLPFGLPTSAAGNPYSDGPRIFSPRLRCKPFDARNGARELEPARVRYRLHICRNALGVDSFTAQQVRSAMAKAAEEFALGGVVLEEESLVHFPDTDCRVSMDDPSWSDVLTAATPPGVLALTFVTGISSASTPFGIGGFCYFFGPVCVNAGVYDTLVVHELGHFFGLAHTFECAYGAETAATCEASGDMICDTPAYRGPSGVYGIALCDTGSYLNGSCSGSCDSKVCTDGSTPDGYDWMSYYHCTPGHFTNEQRDFMRCTLDHELRSYNADATPTTTTTVTSTSTTLAGQECGDVNHDGVLTAADALEVLRAGVGTTECEMWICDYDGSGVVSAADALAVLRAAIGNGAVARCPPHP